MKSNESEGPMFANQIMVFRHLTIDELSQSINMGIFSIILRDRYPEFVKLCNTVINDLAIESISCELKDDDIIFDIKYRV